MKTLRKILFVIEVLGVIVLSILEIQQMVIKANPDPDLLVIILLLGGFLAIFIKITDSMKAMGYSLCYFGGIVGIGCAYYATYAFLWHSVGYGILYSVLGLILMPLLIFLGKDLLKLG